MWLHIKQLAGSREVHVAWLPSHQQRTSGQEDWHFKANQLADQIAGDVAQSRARVALLDVRVQILDVVYDRCWRIQSVLIQRYAFWHGTMPEKPLLRLQGPKQATKAEIVQYAPQTSTTHSDIPFSSAHGDRLSAIGVCAAVSHRRLAGGVLDCCRSCACLAPLGGGFWI